jgi:DNA-directed RNA polymerase specialized sigma24 family protein
MSPVEAITSFRQGGIDRDELARCIYPVLLKIAKTVVWKIGSARMESDDLAQQLWARFEGRILPVYDASQPLEPFLFVHARHECLHMLRDLNKEPLADDGELELKMDTSIGHEDDDASVDRRIGIDKVKSVLSQHIRGYGERAMKEENKNLIVPIVAGNPGMLAHNYSDPTLPELAPTYARPSGTDMSKRRMSESARELSAIRVELDMSMPSFALNLEIGTSRLNSYFYRENQVVPEFIMERARDLLAGKKSKIEFYEKQPASYWIDKWKDELKLASRTALSAYIDCTGPTISRWAAGKSKLTVPNIIRIQSMVDRAKKLMESQEVAVSTPKKPRGRPAAKNASGSSVRVA